MTPDELREIVDYVGGHRAGGEPIDVVVEGESTGPDHLADIAPAYARAGLTWWVEKLGWWRGDLAAATHRVTTGPPPDPRRRRRSPVAG